MADKTERQPFTPADIKRAIRDGSGWCYVSMVDGKPWLTDKCWAAPVTHHLAAFCNTYGIDTAEAASYTIDNAKMAHRTELTPPDIAKIIPAAFQSLDGYHELLPYEAPLTNTAILTVGSADGSPAVVLTSEGIVTAASLTYMRLLGGGYDLGKAKHHGDHRLTFRVERRVVTGSYRLRVCSQTNVFKPMIVILEHELSQTSQTDGRSVFWVEDLRAVLMPMRIGR